MTGHKAELLNKDQPNLKDVIIANAGEDVTKEPWTRWTGPARGATHSSP